MQTKILIENALCSGTLACNFLIVFILEDGKQVFISFEANIEMILKATNDLSFL